MASGWRTTTTHALHNYLLLWGTGRRFGDDSAGCAFFSPLRFEVEGGHTLRDIHSDIEQRFSLRWHD